MRSELFRGPISQKKIIKTKSTISEKITNQQNTQLVQVYVLFYYLKKE